MADVTKAVGYAILRRPVASQVVTKAVGYAILKPPPPEPQDPNGEYLYYRIYIEENNGNTYFTAVVGVELRDGAGVDLVTSECVFSASSIGGSSTAERAFWDWSQDSGDQYWTTESGEYAPAWVRCDFPNKVAVRSFTMTGVREGDRNPRIFRLEASNSGTLWRTLIDVPEQTGWVVGGFDTREWFYEAAEVPHPVSTARRRHTQVTTWVAHG